MAATRHHPNRRTFIQSSTALSAGLLLQQTSPVHARGSEKLKIGIVGTGGRGGGAVTNAFEADANVELYAACDIFEDRLTSKLKSLKEGYGDRVNVPKERQFTGFDGYKQVIDSGVDVVLLTTSPGFRPLHLAYAVEKGKHIFMEKPHAVDPTGIRSVLASVKKAKEKNLCIVSGFCYRYQDAKKETVKRIHDGMIGNVSAIHTTYLTGDLWYRGDDANWSPMERQIRNWYYYTWLSGDFIVEQHIHSIDKAHWVLGELPIEATGIGGRHRRTESRFGNIWDNFSVVFKYASGAKVFSMCRQMSKCHNDVNDHIIGTKGSAQLMSHSIMGEQSWVYSPSKKPLDMYVAEHVELFKAIRSGEVINDGEVSAMSSLMGIMGREAAYTGQRVTWKQILNSKLDLSPKKYAWGENDVPPVAMPGKTKLI